MFPSRTVENYLKAIFQAQFVLEPDQLVQMGQLAAAMGVVPGTATTMVKTLAESGLVRYEPYAGVRLTEAGEKLAAMVLRRHRLIELFLVKVMGMSWAEVHEDAEQLEHAVSDRLIERIDEMLGHPAADPHGDPIPDAHGALEEPEYYDLLSCPLNTPVVVTRVTDQDADFLRFIENSDLKPGQPIQVEARDEAADSVRVRRKDDRRITIGMRAASKLLVTATLALWLIGTAQPAVAQTVKSDASRPFEIVDNSFLVEEAFNQEAGIFQNIFTLFASGERDWFVGFTQEWPIRTQTHQFSYTLAVASVADGRGIEDVLLNYRYQALTETDTRPAFSPRFSVIVPSGSHEKGLGDGVVGWQVNLPFSKQHNNLYLHWNAGATYLPGVQASVGEEDGHDLFIPQLAASGIWRLKPMLNLMLESVLVFEQSVEAPGSTDRTTSLTLSPGFRGGWNLRNHQIIVGLAVPVRMDGNETNTGVFTYFSYELPFVRSSAP